MYCVDMLKCLQCCLVCSAAPWLWLEVECKECWDDNVGGVETVTSQPSTSYLPPAHLMGILGSAANRLIG